MGVEIALNMYFFKFCTIFLNILYLEYQTLLKSVSPYLSKILFIKWSLHANK